VNVAILVGGRGKRIGLDKGFLKLCGRTFIEILVDRFKDCDLVLVCRDEKQAEEYSIFGKTLVDSVRNFGPLAGIYSALKHFENRVLVLAVDMPLVKRELAEFLFESYPDVDAVVPAWSDGKIEPLLACYSHSALKTIEKCLEEGERRVHKAIERMNTAYYPIENLRWFDERLESFINVNSMKDYERLLKVVECSSIDTEGQ